MLALTLGLLLAPQDIPPQPAPPPRASAQRLEETVRTLVSFDTRHILSTTDDPERGTGAARNYLEAQYRELIDRSGGRLKVRRETYPVSSPRRGVPNGSSAVNIVAELPGTTDPERIYVVGGHYDSINSRGSDSKNTAPGANDDGSGTAVALEACRLLCDRQFPATILFVAYDGEEQGLLGSAAHAAKLAEDEATVDGMITNDIVGNTMGMDGVRRPDYLRCFSYAPRGNDSLGRSMARAASWASRRVDGLTIKLIYRGDRYGRGGDHKPFFQQGYPSVRFTEPREDYSRQHKNVIEKDGKPYGDLPSFMDFDYLARVATLNAAVLAELASAPPAPGRIRIRGARESYDVLVSIGEVKGAPAYEVVWRETTAADWQHSKVFRASDIDFQSRGGGRVVLEGVCIDDVVVGVRTVAADGSRSRVTAAPEPDAMTFRSSTRGR